MTALAAVQRNGEQDAKPCFDAWVEVWTPGDTLSARVPRDKQPYDIWVANGFLTLTDPRLVQAVGGRATATGEVVSTSSVLGLASAWACVNLLAGTIAPPRKRVL